VYVGALHSVREIKGGGKIYSFNDFDEQSGTILETRSDFWLGGGLSSWEKLKPGQLTKTTCLGTKTNPKNKRKFVAFQVLVAKNLLEE
jgi:hypothetical protein